MRYFKEDMSDILGYLEQLKELKHRIHEEAFTFLTSDSFHDTHIFSLSVKNLLNPHPSFFGGHS
jgi:hypothetical protein